RNLTQALPGRIIHFADQFLLIDRFNRSSFSLCVTRHPFSCSLYRRDGFVDQERMHYQLDSQTILDN
ncbi:hypothetical protein, partial [Klebsiella aerogenes]|uniref:hypothetical protein n=1 Tax=Klebsiella aerogenes TaxID=548 RepID=UPI001BD07FFA